MLYPLVGGLPKHRILTFAGEWPIPEATRQRIIAAPNLQESDMQPTGYALNTLEAVICDFMNSNSFEEGALKAVNLGGDADTVRAAYGQLADAFYRHLFGEYDAQLPHDWLAVLHEKRD